MHTFLKVLVQSRSKKYVKYDYLLTVVHSNLKGLETNKELAEQSYRVAYVFFYENPK